ncbi:MAG: DNA-binding protein [Lewinellaceae bacterium]|nr:DNA-binding protein [Lewinellaceae bacterium]
MNITFEELRRIKHALPTGSIARIAQDLNIDEQTVRNYFGAHNYEEGQIVEWHLEPGPNGGIVHLEDTTILERAQQILSESDEASSN